MAESLTLRALEADFRKRAAQCDQLDREMQRDGNQVWAAGAIGGSSAYTKCADELAAALHSMTDWLTVRRDAQYHAMQKYKDWRAEGDREHWNIHEHRAAVFQEVLDHLAQAHAPRADRDREE